MPAKMKFEFKGGKKFVRESKKIIAKAAARTANDLARAIKTEVAKDINAEWGIKSRDTKRAISFTRATQAEPVSTMDFSQRRPNLADFSAKPRYEGKYKNRSRKPVGIKYRGMGRAYRNIDHAFFLTASSGKRLAYYRPPGADVITALAGPSVPHLVGRDRIEMIRRIRSQRAKAMFSQNLKFYGGKYAKR